jgi:hypothetical protein
LTRYRIHINKLVLEYDTIKDIETETILFNAVFIVNASSNRIAFLQSAEFRNLPQQCSLVKFLTEPPIKERELSSPEPLL